MTLSDKRHALQIQPSRLYWPQPPPPKAFLDSTHIYMGEIPRRSFDISDTRQYTIYGGKILHSYLRVATVYDSTYATTDDGGHPPHECTLQTNSNRMQDIIYFRTLALLLKGAEHYSAVGYLEHLLIKRYDGPARIRSPGLPHSGLSPPQCCCT